MSNNKTIDEIKNLAEIRAEEIMNNIVDYLNITWDIKAEPKDYKDYCSTYEDYDQLPNRNEIASQFKGLLDANCCTDNLPLSLLKDNIAYSDINQGISPIHSLVNIIYRYGFRYGEKFNKLKNKDSNSSIIYNLFYGDNKTEMSDDDISFLEKIIKRHKENENKKLESKQEIKTS